MAKKAAKKATKKRKAPSKKPNNILVRDRDGIFYEIPVVSAKKFALTGRQLQSALKHFGAEGPVAAGVWAKMSW